MFTVEPEQLNLVGLMLRFLLEATGARRVLVLLPPRVATHRRRKLARWRDVVDLAVQALQLIADLHKSQSASSASGKNIEGLIHTYISSMSTNTHRERLKAIKTAR